MQWEANTSDCLSKGILYCRKAVCTKPFSCGPSAATQQSFCQCESFELSPLRFDSVSIRLHGFTVRFKMQAYESLMKAFLEHNKVINIFSKVIILFKMFI